VVRAAVVGLVRNWLYRAYNSCVPTNRT
jgi:hypothetical protein